METIVYNVARNIFSVSADEKFLRLLTNYEPFAVTQAGKPAEATAETPAFALEVVSESAAPERRICICDSEVSYGEHLMEYLRHEGRLSREIYLYTGRESLLSREDPETTRLLVIAESQYSEEIERAGFSDILLLNESSTYMEKPENMSKYQSVENICERIREMCMTQEEDLSGNVRHGKPMKLIGIYSPVTRCLQTTFALCMGQLLAAGAPALYLNFEAYSGFETMLSRSFRGSVSDLLYFNDCAREKLSGQLQYMTEKIGELDFLPPMESFMLLRSIRAEQWLELLRTIEKVTDYEYCILDLSEQVDGVFEVLRQCDYVFTVTREDGFARAKMTQYEALLKSTQYEDIFMKTRRCRLPVFRELPGNIMMLTHGELAACVKGILEEEDLL